MKFFGVLIATLALCSLASLPEARAHDCEGETTQCWDYCESRYIPVFNADSCGTVWDYGKSCYVAFGYCSKPDAPPCEGETIQCWDYCDSAYRAVANADTCESVWDYERSCYYASGSCSKSAWIEAYLR